MVRHAAMKEELICRKDEQKINYLHFTMDDNLSLSEEIKERYRNQYSGVFYDRYIKGLWVIAEGIIYDMFDYNKHVKTNEDIAPHLTKVFYVSCDYGTQNPTAFLLWRQGMDGKWRILKEYYYSGRATGTQKTDAEFSADMRAWLGDITPRYVVLDPAAASFKAQLEKDGFKVKKANNDVLDGIRYVATCLNEGSFFVDKTCVNLLAEFASYIWDEKAADRGEDRPIKDHDHACDAERYFVHTLRLVKRDASGDSKEDRFNMFL